MNVKFLKLDQLQALIRRILSRTPKTLEDTTLRAVLFVQGEIPEYPPPPKGSTYDRTGTLGRTVTSLIGDNPDALGRVETAFGDVTGFIGTTLEYGPWVIDEDRQTEVHEATGWWTLQEVLRKSSDGIRKIYAAAVGKLIKGR